MISCGEAGIIGPDTYATVPVDLNGESKIDGHVFAILANVRE